MIKYIGLGILSVYVVSCSNNAIVDRSQAPKPSPAPEINIAKPVSFTLDNGLKVFVVADHKLPKVSFQLTVDSDPILEKDKVGLGDLAGELMAEGTLTKTKNEIDTEIDFIGANLTTYAGGIYISSLSKHSDKALEIASDIMLNPSFPAEQLEKKKRQLLSNLKSISANPNAIASRVGSVVSYGKEHPYGEIQLQEHIENITIEDCKAHYETYFRPNVSYLVIVGDITKEEAKAKAEKYFGNWKKKEVPTHKYQLPELVKENRVVFVEKPGAVQSLIQVMYPLDYKIGAEDAASVELMTGVFGGAFSSYLNANLRENKGYTYGARGGMSPDRLVGKFTASASVRNEVTDSSIVQFLAEMKHIVDEEVNEEDLTRIRNNANGNFALSLEKPQTVARFALNTAKYNLPEDYYQNYLSRLDKVTAKEVQEVAKKYIKPAACIILVVGNKDVLESLKQFDADGVIEVLDINGNPKKDLKPVPDGMTAEKVVEQYFYARTNKSNMDEVKALFNKVKAIEYNMEAAIQGMTINMVSKQLAPNYFLSEVKMDKTIMQRQAYNGKIGRSSGMQGAKVIEGEELTALAQEAIMHKELKYKELGYELQLLGIEPILGVEAYKVELTSPLKEVKLQYYDVSTGLLIFSTSTKVVEGNSITSTTEYGDYKSVNGILYPHKRAEQVGNQLIDLTVLEIKINTELKPADFN